MRKPYFPGDPARCAEDEIFKSQGPGRDLTFLRLACLCSAVCLFEYLSPAMADFVFGKAMYFHTLVFVF